MHKEMVKKREKGENIFKNNASILTRRFTEAGSKVVFTLDPVLYRILANRTRRVDLASGLHSRALQTTDPTRTVRVHFAVYTLRLLCDRL